MSIPRISADEAYYSVCFEASTAEDVVSALVAAGIEIEEARICAYYLAIGMKSDTWYEISSNSTANFDFVLDFLNQYLSTIEADRCKKTSVIFRDDYVVFSHICLVFEIGLHLCPVGPQFYFNRQDVSSMQFMFNVAIPPVQTKL